MTRTPHRDLISTTTRGLFRDLMTDIPVGAITTAFQDEGFPPNPDCTYSDSSVRSTTTQEYLESVDWSDPGHIKRVLRVFERLLDGSEDGRILQRFRRSLGRDGYLYDLETSEITGTGARLSGGALAGLRDPAAIQEQLERIQRAMQHDPALVVGTAKELIESTAKTVLSERGLPVDDKADVPALVKEAQQALGLHPSSVTPGPDGSDAVKRILGGLTSAALGVAELRNRGYGTGHGGGGARVGLRHRHAQLAVNAATAWCQLMLDTLADPDAPWRKTR